MKHKMGKSTCGKMVAASGVLLVALLFASPVIVQGNILSETFRYQESPDTAWDIAWSPDGNLIAVATGPVTCNENNSSLHIVRILNVSTGQLIRELSGHTCVVRSVAWSPDGTRLATSSEDGDGRVWNVSTGQTISTTHGEAYQRVLVTWSPDSDRVAGSFLNSIFIQVWDATTGTDLLSINEHTDYVTSLVWNPIDNRIASASSDSTVKIWDATTGQLLLTLQGHSYAVFSVAWSPDGTKLASGGEDNTVYVWDGTTGQSLLTLQGHTNAVESVTWSPDGTRLASGSDDGTIRIWDINTGQVLDVLQSNAGPILKVAWSPNGTRLAYIGSDSGIGSNILEIVRIGCTVTVPDGALSEIFLAIEDANQTGNPTTICLAPGGTYTLNNSVADFFGPTGIPPVTGTVTIVGDGATIQRDLTAFEHFRIFGVEDPGILTLENLTLQNGLLDQNAGAAIVNVGGTVNLNGVSIINNEATDPGGQGGGIFNYFGTLNVNNSRILDNRAASGAAAVYNQSGDVTIGDSCVVNNYAPDGFAVKNFEASDINAVNNWWGASDGPSGDGPGSGDGISEGVLFDPFLTTAPAGCPASSPPPTPTPTATAAPTDTPTPAPTPTTVVVSLLEPQGWTFSTAGLVPPVYTFLVGPGTPPMGQGSLRVIVSVANSRFTMRPPMSNISTVASLLPLTYSTYRSTSLTKQFYIQLFLDTDGNPATCETRLDYTPTSSSIHTWEMWNAGTGTWRQKSGGCTGGGTFTDVTLDPFLSATVVDITFNTGDTTNGFVNFNGAIDAIHLGSIIYDFELLD